MTHLRTMEISVLRHAKPCVAGLCYGQTDVAVELPAAIAAQRVIATTPGLAARVEVIWTSHLVRANQLAQALAALLHREVRTDPRLAELNFGQWEGRLWDEIYRSDGPSLSRWASDSIRRSPPSGESGLELFERVMQWLSDEVREGMLVVTHAGPIRVLRALAQEGFDMRTPTIDFDRKVDPLAIETIAIPQARLHR